MKNYLLKKWFNIPFVKKYCIGKEYLKNPPRVVVNDFEEVKNLKIINATLVLGSNSIASNCVFEQTIN